MCLRKYLRDFKEYRGMEGDGKREAVYSAKTALRFKP